MTFEDLKTAVEVMTEEQLRRNVEVIIDYDTTILVELAVSLTTGRVILITEYTD